VDEARQIVDSALNSGSRELQTAGEHA